MRRLSMLLLCAGSMACGTLGSDQGGADNLPQRGIGPYEKLALAEGDFLFLSTDEETVEAPAALVSEGQLDVYFIARGAGAPVRVERARAVEALAFAPAVTVLTTEGAPAWVGEDLAGPSLTYDGARLWMALSVAGGTAIALIPSDDGATFDWGAAVQALQAAPGELLTSPSLVWDEDRFLLYFGGDGSVRLATGDPANGFTRQGVVLSPDDSCEGGCWDAEDVGQPDVRRAVGGAGETLYRMFYASARLGKHNIGFAASHDGFSWVRSARNPVLQEGPDEREPSAIRFHDDYYLFFIERRAAGDSGVRAARAAEGTPTDSW